MDDATYLFSQTSRERKSLARQAKYRKNGSKSRRCPMSTDNMTHKQWKERNGEVLVCDIGAPISWQKFKTMSHDSQQIYIKELSERFEGLNSSSLAEMWNISTSTIRRYFDAKNIYFDVYRGMRMSNEVKELWSSFLSGDLPLHVEEEPEEVISEENVPKNVGKPMTMTNVGFVFQGNLDPSMITNSLIHIVGNGTNCRVEVNCTILD